MRLLLASQSATRRAMLAQAGVPFETVATTADEEAVRAEVLSADPEISPARLAYALAVAKALGADAPPEALVMGADQTLERDDGSLETKAANRGEARAQLARLAGRPHYLHSAAVLVRDGSERWSETQTVAMHMRAISAAYLKAYVDREYEAAKFGVGCYRIEGLGAQLFERVSGSHFAILGLPLLPLLAELRRLGVLTS